MLNPYGSWMVAKERHNDILRWSEARRQQREAQGQPEPRGRLVRSVRVWTGNRLIALGERLAERCAEVSNPSAAQSMSSSQ